jgi:hypothetical protein
MHTVSWKFQHTPPKHLLARRSFIVTKLTMPCDGTICTISFPGNSDSLIFLLIQRHFCFLGTRVRKSTRHSNHDTPSSRQRKVKKYLYDLCIPHQCKKYPECMSVTVIEAVHRMNHSLHGLLWMRQGLALAFSCSQQTKKLNHQSVTLQDSHA